MTLWDDRVEAHAVHSVLAELATVVSAADEREDSPLSAKESLHRIRTSASFISSVLSRIDALLAPLKVLDGISGNLEQVRSAVSTYVDDGNEAHLTGAHAALDAALQLSQAVPAVESAADVNRLRDSISDYRRSAGQHVRYLQEEVDALRQKLSELQEEATAAEAETGTRVSSLKSEADAQLEAYRTEIGQQKARLDQAIQNFVEQSSQSRDKHSNQVTEVVTTGREEIAEVVTDAQTKLSKHVSDLRAESTKTMDDMVGEARAVIEELASSQENAAEIVGIIARTGMAGGYQQQADEERRQADLWRWIAVAGMAAIVALAVWMVFSVATDSADTTALLTKSFTTLTLGILAGYAGREAGKHRRREQRNRRLQLELSSIDSYLETLPEAERNAIKGALADRLFGNPDPPTDGDTEGVRPASMMDLVKLLMPMAEK